ncbi:MAG TPA: hypothetical protein VMW16_15960 [Sedimentisphaerales bacterium]|nr:hypothetical protein [Sedimentisphaerales bacterium]
MRLSRTLLTILVVLACASYAKAKNQIQVQCQIFRLEGNLPSKTFVDEPIWTTDETPKELKNKVIVFSRGWFKLGKDRLEFKEGRCFLNKTELPLAGPEKVKLPEQLIRMIYRPVVIEMAEHSGGEISIEPTQPIQYFEKRADGLYELKEMELQTGLYVKITEAVEEEDKGYIRLTDIIMTIRLVGSRERIEGVNLPVGRPILSEEEYVFYFRVRPGKDYGILITPERGQGGLLIRLRASSTSSGTLPKSNQKIEQKN